MDLVYLISSVGFPIAMCFYLVMKLEKTLEKNTQALYSLKEALQKK